MKVPLNYTVWQKEVSTVKLIILKRSEERDKNIWSVASILRSQLNNNSLNNDWTMKSLQRFDGLNQKRRCERTIMVAVDLSKSFDTVSHVTLVSARTTLS